MSNGYTMAFAITAPVAPATASPHGGRASFVPAILRTCRLSKVLEIPVKEWSRWRGGSEARDRTMR